MQHIFESLPVVLACYSAIVCARQFANDRRVHHKRVLLLGVICSLLLIVAQTSWYVTYTINGNLMGTVFANNVWTVFNNLTMLAFILLAHGGTKNVAKSTPSGN